LRVSRRHASPAAQRLGDQLSGPPLMRARADRRLPPRLHRVHGEVKPRQLHRFVGLQPGLYARVCIY
jgi:hypothetical protein